MMGRGKTRKHIEETVELLRSGFTIYIIGADSVDPYEKVADFGIKVLRRGEDGIEIKKE